MRDAEEARLVMNPEPVTPLGPSVYTKPTGHGPEAGPAVCLTPAPAGPCVYTQRRATIRHLRHVSRVRSESKGQDRDVVVLPWTSAARAMESADWLLMAAVRSKPKSSRLAF